MQYKNLPLTELKYFLYYCANENIHHLFLYDTKRNQWVIEFFKIELNTKQTHTPAQCTMLKIIKIQQERPKNVL